MRQAASTEKIQKKFEREQSYFPMVKKMPVSRKHLDILCHYHDDYVAGPVEYLGTAGGYSGALFWKVRGAKGEFCLRRWTPQCPTLEQLQFIHAVLWYANQEGFRKTPQPVETLEYLSYVADERYFWQLEPWMRGASDFHHQPSPERIAAAMMALAEFHQSVRHFPLSQSAGGSSLLASHEKALLEWNSGRFEQLRQAMEWQKTKKRRMTAAFSEPKVLFISDLSDSNGSGVGRIGNVATIVFPTSLAEESPLPTLASRILDSVEAIHHSLLIQLVRCGNYSVPLQPCIRDIHAEHVFFVQNQVTGFIDFEAMQADNVAVDVARLLGSLTTCDPLGWVLGLAAYESVRPLSEEEREMVYLCRKSHLAVTALRWLDYIFTQKNSVKCSANMFHRLKNMETSLEYF